MIQKSIQLAIVIEIWPDLIKNSNWGEKEIYDLLIKAGFIRFFFRINDEAYGFNNSHLILRISDNFFGLAFKDLIEYYLESTPIHFNVA